MENNVEEFVKWIRNSDNIVFLNYVSNKELVGYYKNADLFVYPSLYEGFGIPPIEAMSQHCPVLVSDIDVLHEVCGEAAFYCNPSKLPVNVQMIIFFCPWVWGLV